MLHAQHSDRPPTGPVPRIDPDMEKMRRDLADDAPHGRIRVESVSAPAVRVGGKLLVLLGFR